MLRQISSFITRTFRKNNISVIMDSHRPRHTEIVLVLVGDVGVGKGSLISSYCDNEIPVEHIHFCSLFLPPTPSRDVTVDENFYRIVAYKRSGQVKQIKFKTFLIYQIVKAFC